MKRSLPCIAVLCAMLSGCAARKERATPPSTVSSAETLPPCAIANANQDCIDGEGNRLGTEGWHCPVENDVCYRTRNHETPAGRPILTPLGCAFKRVGILWIFGDRESVCVKKERKP